MLAEFLPAFDFQPGGVIRLAVAVEAGAVVCRVSDGEKSIGLFAYRIEGVELDILAAVADAAAGFSVTADVMPKVEAMAAAAGCRAVTFETFRPGLMRRMQADGWRGVAVRMWKEVE